MANFRRRNANINFAPDEAKAILFLKFAEIKIIVEIIINDKNIK